MPERGATKTKKTNTNEMKNLLQQLVAAASVLIVAFIMGFRAVLCDLLAGLQTSDLVATANTYDAAVETHESAIRRTNDAAVTARHLLWKKGAADGTVALNGATDIPLGTIDNIEAGTGLGQSVLLLGKGSTKKMVASGGIAAGARVAVAANGKVRAVPAGAGSYPIVGTALTAAVNDNDILEVADCVPFNLVVT